MLSDGESSFFYSVFINVGHVLTKISPSEAKRWEGKCGFAFFYSRTGSKLTSQNIQGGKV